jgi:hypothetical protein
MRMTGLIFLAAAAALFSPSAGAGAIGVFTQADGEVRILRGENYLAAQTGVEVEKQDVIETALDAAAQLDMEDGSVLKLGPETRLALSEYELDSDHSVVSAGLDVLAGWVRFAVAKLRSDRSYSFRTPVMTVGVRGTEGVIEAANEAGGLHLEEGAVEVGGAGPDAKGFALEHVTAGQFVQRQRGQGFQRFDRPPPAFAGRLPPGVQHKLKRRAIELRERGVPPRVIRKMTREDAQRFMQRHPYANDRVRERFRPTGVNVPPLVPGGNHPGPRPPAAANPAARDQYLQNHPKARERVERRRVEGKGEDDLRDRKGDAPIDAGPKAGQHLR